MSTYREVVHMILDELKMNSDDNYYTTDHVMFLVDKYRALFLKKAYTTYAKELPDVYYQTLCVDLEVTDKTPDLPCDGKILRSVKPIPQVIQNGKQTVFFDGYFGVAFTIIPRERMRHVGHDKWRRNVIYCAMGPDMHLYFTSANPQHLYLKSVKFKAVFEEYKDALAMSCDPDDEGVCDPLDGKIRMEEAFIPYIIDSVVKELSIAAYRPADPTNNASDDLSITSDTASAAKAAQKQEARRQQAQVQDDGQQDEDQ